MGEGQPPYTPRPRPSHLDTLLRMTGRSGPPRWTDPRGRNIYTYDGAHGGEIEVFDAKSGVHLAVLDIYTGVVIKPAVKGRSIDV